MPYWIIKCKKKNKKKPRNEFPIPKLCKIDPLHTFQPFSFQKLIIALNPIWRPVAILDLGRFPGSDWRESNMASGSHIGFKKCTNDFRNEFPIPKLSKLYTLHIFPCFLVWKLVHVITQNPIWCLAAILDLGNVKNNIRNEFPTPKLCKIDPLHTFPCSLVQKLMIA